MRKQLCLITGGTSGIGKALASELAHRDSTDVIISGRDESICRHVIQEIRSNGGRGFYYLADFKNMNSMRTLVEDIANRHSQLDFLINNASVIRERPEKSDYGVDMHYAVNYFSYYILAVSLLNRGILKRGSVVFNITSSAHRRGRFDQDECFANTQGRYSKRTVYSNTKYLEVLFTHELAKRILKKGITASCYNPGMTYTKMLKDFLGVPKFCDYLLKVLTRSPESVAKEIADIITSKDIDTGYYYNKSRIGTSIANIYGSEESKALWEFSERVTGIRLSV